MSEGKKSSLAKNPCYHITKDPDRTNKRLKFSLRKERATITYKDGHSDVQCLFTLIDLSEQGTGVFSSHLLPKGALVTVRVDSPMRLLVPGMVVWSVPVASGIANRKFPYRSGILFQFEKEEEKQNVLNFMERAADGNWKIDPPPVVVPDPATIVAPADVVPAAIVSAPEIPPVVTPTPDAAAIPAAPVVESPSAVAPDPTSAPMATVVAEQIRAPGLDGAVVAAEPLPQSTAIAPDPALPADPEKKAA